MSDRQNITVNHFWLSHAKKNLCWIFFAILVITPVGTCWGDQPDWIWSPTKAGVGGINSEGECYFRKKFTLIRPDKGEIEIAAGDEYEVYINGRLVSRGQLYASSTKIDVIEYLEPGINLIAAKVRHNDGNQVGLAMRFRVKEKGESRWRSLLTDQSWKTRTRAVTKWMSTGYNDLAWLRAKVVTQSPVETTQPADRDSAQSQPPETLKTKIKSMLNPLFHGKQDSTDSTPNGIALTENSESVESAMKQRIEASSESKVPTQQVVATNQPTFKIEAATKKAGKKNVNHRFEISPEFAVEQVFGDDETGSLIAMEFDEFGKLLLSREGGPLLIADPSKPLNHPGRVRVYCNTVNSCQGILPLNGDVYVTAIGPEGMGLYRLSDTDRDGRLEVNKKLAGFSGQPGEHGPHGIQLGPDGMIYVIVGNASQIESVVADTSPFQNFYEGDLIPRFEDPSGHAAGVKAPGGTIIRVSLDGSKIERFAGGIRNAYDLVFDHRGELFIHDSDMESDIGTTWYRPTMVFHVPAGAEFGWRSGSAKFPISFVDQTPPVCDTGRGSPAGAVLYQHLQFPVRYQDSIFLADWSEGRILVLRSKESGAGYVSKTETFLKGRPLNVVDLAVGEDGALYFCTGGRGTSGGVYRVNWKGSIPDKILEFESDLAKAIRQPQPGSAWARQNIANLKVAMGDSWSQSIEGVAGEARNTEKFRLRAMQLMILYGPVPSQELLESLAKDENHSIRAKTAQLCGLKQGPECEMILRELIQDANPIVRRAAGESFLRIGVDPELSSIISMLKAEDRIESLTARRLLERIDSKLWESQVFESEDKRLFIQGSVALMTADPNLDRAYQVLARASKFMEGFINDRDFVDMLRAMELALIRGNVEPSRVPGLAIRIGNEFPSGSSQINRELVRLLAYLESGDLAGRIKEYAESKDISTIDKVHLGMHMQAISGKLTPATRLSIIDCLESASKTEGAGEAYKNYIQQAVVNLARSVTPDEIVTILDKGHRWPNAVLAAFYQLPHDLNEETVQTVIALDKTLAQLESPGTAETRLRLGVIGILARSGDELSMDYLRQIWREESDRRNDIVIGLAQQPAGDNWAYLVDSLPELEDLIGIEVMEKLAGVSRRPRDAKHYRNVIQLGYRLRGEGSNATVRLLEHWSGEQKSESNASWDVAMNQWRTWFHEKWPNQEKIIAAVNAQKIGRYSIDQLLVSIEKMGAGDPQRGHQLFNAAQCANCHQFGKGGTGMGPDLTSLAQRFTLREAVEATVNPSHVVPDRYVSKTILTTDGLQITGMAVKGADGSYVVMESDGRRVRVAANEVDDVKSSSVSAMPEGLLDPYSVEEIRDLFSYLMPGKQQQTVDARTQQKSLSQASSAPIR